MSTIKARIPMYMIPKTATILMHELPDVDMHHDDQDDEDEAFAMIPDIDTSPRRARRRREAYLRAWSSCQACIHVRGQS
jgi:hypothetical protein